MDRSALLKLEKWGARPNPTLETLVRYSEAVGNILFYRWSTGEGITGGKGEWPSTASSPMPSLLLHVVYVAFVVLGMAAILAGIALGWQWVRNFWFRSFTS